MLDGWLFISTRSPPNLLAMEQFDGVLDSGVDADGIRNAALGHVFAAAATAAELRHRLFHQCAHIIGLSGGLGED